jgi:hypothetical protein
MADDVQQPARPKRKRARSGGANGRPKWVPTPEHIKEVEDLAARGLTYQEIADALGISISTLYERRAEFANFAAAFKKGKAAGTAIMAGVVFDTANNKNMQPGLRLGAAQFYLARRAGWHEKSEGAAVEVNINGQPVSIDDRARERDEQIELLAWLTPQEKSVILDLYRLAQRRQRGEEPMVHAPALPTLGDDFKPIDEDGNGGET